MRNYRCISCGKLFDPEKEEICPACGAAVAPSVLTRIERKRTAARLRAEGNTHFDERCHEDDGWSSNSYGAQSRRAAVRAHEAELRAGYAAHSSADHPTRVSNANPKPSSGSNPSRVSNANAGQSAGSYAASRQSAGASAAPARKRKKTLGDRVHQNPALLLLILLLPLALAFATGFIRSFLAWLEGFAGIGFRLP